MSMSWGFIGGGRKGEALFFGGGGGVQIADAPNAGAICKSCQGCLSVKHF